GGQEILGKHGAVQIAKRSELHTFKVMPKRWIVERSFAWLEKNRRLWKNCERRLNTSLQFIHLAFLALLLRRS
ncbi:transposase, partial [Xanthomonas oryzae pv. oryzae]|uniref:transposase n=1 Tax=Xanthomonas oryzae TaxID=347 RepID=UPI0009675097